MKYNEQNKPLVCMMTQSTCYKGTGPMTPLGVLWHSTGANNPTLKRYVQPDDNASNRAELLSLLGKNQYNNDWNHIEHRAGLNAWIGKLADGTVTTVQTLPWNYKPWGCGKGNKGTCNNAWMQFEICEDNLENRDYFEAAYKEACELTAYYCKMYNLDPKGTVTYNGVKVPVILCHYDSYHLGLGSNHGDIYHWFKKYGKDMDSVRNDVAAILNADKGEEKPAEKPTENSGVEIKKGDIVTLVKGATYYSGKDIPDWVEAKAWIVSSISGDRAVIDKSEDGKNSICSPVNVKYLVKKNQSSGSASTPAPAPSTTTSKPTLRKGDKNDSVKTLQTKLKELGFDCEGIDGSFGARTEKQVKAFQKERGLEQDGVCGPKTWAAIESFKAYNVKVHVGVLNVRSGPSTNYSVKKQVKTGTAFTIVYKTGSWSKIKDGAGWVWSEYITKT